MRLEQADEDEKCKSQVKVWKTQLKCQNLYCWICYVYKGACTKRNKMTFERATDQNFEAVIEPQLMEWLTAVLKLLWGCTGLVFMGKRGLVSSVFYSDYGTVFSAKTIAIWAFVFDHFGLFCGCCRDGFLCFGGRTRLVSMEERWRSFDCFFELGVNYFS